MGNLAQDRTMDAVALGAVRGVQVGVKAASVLYEGAMVACLTADGYAVRGGTASTGAIQGIAEARGDNSASGASDGDVSANLLQGAFWRENSATHPVLQAHFGKVLFAEDDQTLSCDSTDGPVAGICCGIDSDLGVLVYCHSGLNYLLDQATLETALASTANTEGAFMLGVEDAAGRFAGAQGEAVLTDLGGRIALAFADTAAQTAYSATAREDRQIAIVDNDDAGAHADSSLWMFDSGSAAGATDWVRVPDAGTGRWLRILPTLAELASVANGYGAALLGVEDASSYWTGTDGEAVLDEIGQDMVTTQEQANVPLVGLLDKDGDPLVKFVDGDTEVPGYNLADAEAFGIRWNNKATHDPFLCQVSMPQDLDDTADVVVHYLASKTGNTLADATTFTSTAFFHTVGALHDADADCGGASSAMTGDAAAKTIQEETLTIAAADVPASPSSLSITVQPTDGTLDTDDVILEGLWLEYTRKKMTS